MGNISSLLINTITLLITVGTLLTNLPMKGFPQTYRWHMAASETEGPGARSRPLLAFDSIQRNVVMYGGLKSAHNSFDDTWAWDGDRWLQISNEGPGVGDGCAMAFQDSFEQLVLFGGIRDGVPIDDTWIWDGKSWFLLETNGPTARYGHAMVYDPIQEQIILHGGITISKNGEYITLHDSWSFDGMQWKQLIPEIGSPILNNARGYHRLIFDSSSNNVLSFFGLRKKSLETSYQSQPASGLTVPFIGKLVKNNWQITSHNSNSFPSPRATASVAYDSDRQKTVVYGGGTPFGHTEFNQVIKNDLWEWDNITWRKILDVENSPKPISDCHMIYDSDRNTFVLFGGVVQYKQQRYGNSSLRRKLNGITWELSVTNKSTIPNFTFYEI